VAVDPDADRRLPVAERVDGVVAVILVNGISQDFETIQKRGTYCSTECRVKAWRANRRQPPASQQEAP
jgi:hypothetical protein